GARPLGDRGARKARGEGRGAANRRRGGPVRGARGQRPRRRGGGAAPDLLIVLCALALALAAPAPAVADENLADEPPFGGRLPPPLVRPPSDHRAPPGFRLSAGDAIRVA